MWNGVGAVAQVVQTLLSWTLSEDGYAAWKRRRAVRAQVAEAKQALQNHDWARVRGAVDTLERLSKSP